MNNNANLSMMRILGTLIGCYVDIYMSNGHEISMSLNKVDITQRLIYGMNSSESIRIIDANQVTGFGTRKKSMTKDSDLRNIYE